MSVHCGKVIWPLTTVRAHVDLQGAGTGAALVALGEGADALVGVGLLGGLVLGQRGGGRGGSGGGGCGGRLLLLLLLLPAGAVVHEVGLQVPLAAVPDPAVLTGEDVLCGEGGRSSRREEGERKKGGQGKVEEGGE